MPRPRGAAPPARAAPRREPVRRGPAGRPAARRGGPGPWARRPRPGRPGSPRPSPGSPRRRCRGPRRRGCGPSGGRGRRRDGRPWRPRPAAPAGRWRGGRRAGDRRPPGGRGAGPGRPRRARRPRPPAQVEHGGADHVVVARGALAAGDERQGGQVREEGGRVAGFLGGGGADVLVEGAWQGAGEGRLALLGRGVAAEEAVDGGGAREDGVARMVGQGRDQHGQPGRPLPDSAPGVLVADAPRVEQASRLVLGERFEGQVGGEVGMVAPEHRVGPVPPGEGQHQVARRLAVPVGGGQVAQPRVEERRGVLVRVEEQGGPRHLLGHPPQLGEEHRAQRRQRVEHQPHIVQIGRAHV